MRVRAASVVLGAAFGFLISWGQFVSPDRIRQMLLLEDGYMWMMFVVAVAVPFAALRLMRRLRFRALLTGAPVSWTTARPQRRQLMGAALFGVGWAVSDVCPGPVVAQIGQGVTWALPLLAGVVGGVWLYTRQTVPVAPREAEAPARRGGGSRIGAALPASNPD